MSNPSQFSSSRFLQPKEETLDQMFKRIFRPSPVPAPIPAQSTEGQVLQRRIQAEKGWLV